MNPIASINEPGGYRVDIFETQPFTTLGRYHAERTAPDGSVTTPQTNMTPEDCIRYLAHLANGYAYEASLGR